MKRKIALLLAFVMIFSLIPATVFANDAAPAREIRSWVLGRVATPVAQPTDATGENFNVTVDLQNLRRAIPTITSGTSPNALVINLQLSGASDTYLRFTDPTLAGNAGLPIIPGLEGVSSDHDFTAHMWVTGHQTAQIWLWMSPAAAGAFPHDITGQLDLPLPFPIRVQEGGSWLEAFLGPLQANVILSEGPLTAFAARGIDIRYQGDPVRFEWVAELNAVRIVELAPFALMPPDAWAADPYGSVRATDTGDLYAARARRQYRALAIRLTAPENYYWASEGPTVGRADGRVWDADASPAAAWVDATDNRVTLTSPNNVLTFGSNAGAPVTGEGGNNLRAMYTYFTPAGRHEKLIIIETVDRIADVFLRYSLAEIHVNNLVLVPGENAPATGNVDILARVGHVGAFRDHAMPRVLDGAGPATLPVGPPAAAPVITPPGPWTDMVQAAPAANQLWLNYCYAGFSFRGTNHPAWLANSAAFDRPANAPEFITFQQVEQATRRRIVQAGVHPWGMEGVQVTTTTTGGSVIHGPGSQTAFAQSLGLDWQAFPADTHTRTLTVAVRAQAGLELTIVEDDLVALRSGAVNYTNNIPQAMHDHTTGRTSTLRVQEVVANSLHVGIGRPVTFDLGEGVVLTGVQFRFGSSNDDAWTTVVRPAQGAAPHQNVTFTDNTVSIRQALAANRSGTIRMEVRFFVSIEAGFEHLYGDMLEATVAGSGVLANLNPAENSIEVAEVYDPIVVSNVTPIQVNFVGNEQNINHTSIGERIYITETAPEMLELGTQIWLYVSTRYGIGWPLMISRGQTISGTGGLELTVTENRNFLIGLSNELGGGSIRAIQLTVTNESRGEAGVITLDGTTLFGHVYQGEVYYLVVTGPAVAANHNVVANGNPMGTFRSLPYGVEVVEPAQAVDGTDPDRRANSLADVVFSPDVAVGGVLPPVIWYRAEGMQFAAGFLAARSFAVAAGVEESGIQWDGSTREAIITGYNYQGAVVSILLTQGSTIAVITTAGVAQEVDIAEFAGQSGPAGTLSPIFRYNRIYLPARFLFNAFGYSSDYNFSREGNNLVVSPLR